MEANVLLKRTSEFSFTSQKVVVFKLSRPKKAPPDSATRALIGEKRWMCSNNAELAERSPTPLLTQQLVCNLDVLPDSPREPPPAGHLTRHRSTFHSHSITTSRTHIRRHIEAHTMVHYYNEKRHVQGPEAPLNQRVGGNSTDLLKTFDVPTVFGWQSIFRQAETETSHKNPDFTSKNTKQ